MNQLTRVKVIVFNVDVHVHCESVIIYNVSLISYTVYCETFETTFKKPSACNYNKQNI